MAEIRKKYTVSRCGYSSSYHIEWCGIWYLMGSIRYYRIVFIIILSNFHQGNDGVDELDDDGDNCVTTDVESNPFWSVNLKKKYNIAAVQVKTCDKDRE